MKTKVLIVLLILLSGNLYAQEKTFSSKELNGVNVSQFYGKNEIQISWKDGICTHIFILENGDKRFSESYFYLSDKKDEVFDMKKLETTTEGRYLILKFKAVKHLTPMVSEIYRNSDSTIVFMNENRKMEYKIIKKE